MHTLANDASYEETIKKSRFIARAAAVHSVEEALQFIERVREAEATHNCWAYKIDQLYRFSDDGEPGGTAGRPILAAIEGQGCDHAVVVVTRYFGGVKLGAGGLVRAYGGTAAQCLRAAAKTEIQKRVRLAVLAPFECVGDVYLRLERLGFARLDEQFNEQGLRLVVEVLEEQASQLTDAVRDATRGRGSVEPAG